MANWMSTALAVLIGMQTGAVLTGMTGSEPYPTEALQLGEQGTVVLDLTISEKGRATVCRVMRSSGSKSLDYASCRIAVIRMRYAPAKNASGASTSGTAALSVQWQIDCGKSAIESHFDGVQVCADRVPYRVR